MGTGTLSGFGKLELTKSELEGYWLRLHSLLRKHYGLVAQAAGLNLDDIVIEVFESIYSGERRWPPLDNLGNEKPISFLTFLFQVARSKISHALVSSYKHISIDQPNMPQLEAKEQSDDIAEYNELCKILVRLAKDDLLVLQIVQAKINDPDIKLCEIAEVWNIPIKEIYNAKKRLRRLKDELEKEWSGNNE
jgi:DNA-directed RNA polymerase specialized sigma24 family protein